MVFPDSKFRSLSLILFLGLMFKFAYGEHLVGGDLTYKCLGKTPQGLNEYELTLSVYRDCIPSLQFPISNTPFDKNITIYIRDGRTMASFRQVGIALQDSIILELTTSDTCVSPPDNLCYTLATYKANITLPDNPNGYHLAWARCCRNRTIQNILVPESSGMILPAYIPSTDLCNNSPQFVQTLPTYICVNENFQFDHSATDEDGDSLVYSLTVPFTAGDRSDPFPIPSAPPYQTVNWRPPFDINNVMNGNPNLSVNSETGLMTVRPRQAGQYVFSLSVFEYRNGILLSEVKRDIQINVIECPINFPPEVERPVNDQVRGDTLIFYRGLESCFDFNIIDLNGPGVPEDQVNVTVKGGIFEAIYGAEATTESGLSPLPATICWAPGCDIDQLSDNRIIITAVDEDDCPGPNITHDTMYVKILPGQVFPPDMECVSVLDPSRIQITWNGLDAGSQKGFESYLIYRQEGSEWTQIATVTDPSTHTFVDSSVNAQSREYCYRVQTVKICPDLLISEPGLELCSTSGDDVEICRVSVTTDSGVEVIWNPLVVSSFTSFRIYAKAPGDGDYQVVGEVDDPTATRWLDTMNFATEGSYCYRIAVVDPCGSEIFSRPHCTVFLSIREDNDRLRINWQDYKGWTSGVSGFELFSVNEMGDQVLISEFPFDTRNYTDGSVMLEEGKYCYVVKAQEATPGCGIESFSNIACYTFVPRIFVPNAFTPNRDGHNDLFFIKGGFLREFQLSIYNRWGQLLFTTRSFEDGWDGTYRGAPVQEGVYVFRLSGTDFNGNIVERSGSITLLR